MLDGTALSVANYDATLAGWSAQPNIGNNVFLGVNGLEYCQEAGRNVLVNDKFWFVIGDSKTTDPTCSN